LHRIAGNFLTIQRRVLNFKIFVLSLKFKKYKVRRFVPSPVRVPDKFPHAQKPGCQPKLKKLYCGKIL
jgi:hypothetical protein